MLSGNGSMQANGAAAGNLLSGGGAGGRIAVYYADASSFTGLLNTVALGGKGRTYGGTGTVVFIDTSVEGYELNIYRQAELFDENSPDHEFTFTRVNLFDGAILGWADAQLLQASQLNIAANAMILADGLGYAAGNGPGRGQDHPEGGGGAGYGGAGGRGQYASGGDAYGSETDLTQPGSGGGNADTNGHGGDGGGRIKLVVTDLMVHNGIISANAMNGSENGGGGSGGAIDIEVGNIMGSGILRAQGGAGGNYYAGGGAGGRIFLRYGFMGDYTGWSASSVAGAKGRQYGQDGTLLAISRDAIVILEMADENVEAGAAYTSPVPQVINGIDPVVWTLEEGPDGMIIDPGSGIVSWATPVASTTPYTIHIRATNADESGYDDESWQIMVRAIPQITPIDNVEILRNSNYNGPVPVISNLVDAQPVTWRLMSGPADMTINSTTGQVNWPQARVDGSPYTVTIRATNTVGYSEVSWQVIVLVPPIIADIPNVTIPAGMPYESPAPVLLEGAGQMTWTLVAGPAGAVIDPVSGTVSWDNPTVAGSPHTVTIRAENMDGFDEETWTLTVMAIPQIAPMNDAAVEEGGNFIGTIPVITNGAANVVWSLQQAPVGMSIDNQTGLVSWNNASIAGSPYEVIIKACNTVGCGTVRFNLTVTLGQPVIGDIANQYVAVGSVYTGPRPNLIYGDSDIVWDLVFGPEGMTIDPATGIVSWPVVEMEGSPHTVTISATNSEGTDYENWQLIVVQAPEVAPLNNETVTEGILYQSPIPQLVEQTFVAWSLVQGPSGMTINSQTGQVTWSKPRLENSPYTIRIQAANAAGTSQISWQLTVLPTPPSIAPMADDYFVEHTFFVGVKPTLTQGTTPIEWSLISAPTGMTINNANGVVTWQNPVRSANPYTITMKATNASGSDQTSWLLKPLEAPDIAPIDDQDVVAAIAWQGPTPILTVDTRVSWALITAPEGLIIDTATGKVSWANPVKDGSPHEVTIQAAQYPWH